MSVWFVYVDYTGDGRPFYVGKGTYKRIHTRERDNEHWKSIRDKHGWRREVVYGTKDENAAYDHETFLIAEYNTFSGWGANHTAGGPCGQTGLKRSEETRRKLRESHLGKTPWNKGVPQTEEHRRKNSECRRGKKRGATSPETKAKIAAAHRARSIWTPEFVELLRQERASGLLIREVAAKFGLSKTSVTNALNYGVPGMRWKQA